MVFKASLMQRNVKTKRLRNDWALAHKIQFNPIDLEAANRKNPQKKKPFCMGGFLLLQPLDTCSRFGNRTAKKIT